MARYDSYAAGSTITGTEKFGPVRQGSNDVDFLFNDIRTWIQLARTPVALTYATTIALDASTSRTYTLTMTGSGTLAFPTNLTAGAEFRVFIYQDGTGSRTLAYASGWKFPNGIVPVLTSTASALDILSAVYDGTALVGNLVKGNA